MSGRCGEYRGAVMTGQDRDIRSLLDARLELIRAIAEANSEALRLQQIAGGMMFLDQKDEEDGTVADPRAPERDANAAALERCRDHIETLEARLSDLDRALGAATEGQTP